MCGTVVQEEMRTPGLEGPEPDHSGRRQVRLKHKKAKRIIEAFRTSRLCTSILRTGLISIDLLLDYPVLRATSK
jgi:hypothetical protein